MSREKTMEEVREEVLDHIRGMVDYWNEIEKAMLNVILQVVCMNYFLESKIVGSFGGER